MIALKKLYREKDYHNVEIKASLQDDETSDKAIAIFTIDENKKTQIKEYFLRGIRLSQIKAVAFTYFYS